MAQRTVVVGGGLAGLAAATALAQQSVPVTVLESRPRLGGRASSFVDKTTGTPIDNCQHVALGCCTNFRHFCRTLGLEDFFRTEDALYFIGRDNIVNRLAASNLPAPLHFLSSFARLSYLSFYDLYRIALAMRALARWRAGGNRSLVFSDWLRDQRQTPAAVERFWNPVVVSALSESLDRVDVASARKVFVDAFLSNRDGWRVQIPTVPLDALYGVRMTRWFAERGTAIRLQAGVDRIAIENGRAVGAVLRSGEMVPADHFVVAVPHWLVLDLLPAELREHPDLARIRGLESAPISSVHLWFDRPILYPQCRSSGHQVAENLAPRELPHAVLIDRLSQWIFNRDLLQSAGAPETATSPSLERRAEGHSYQVVISASRNVVSEFQDEAIAKVVEELREIFPACHGATLLHSRLVTEHRAVFSSLPGAEDCRPRQQSPVANLQWAGDWTNTGWPATMEGAVRSGYLAAENILRQLGNSGTLVQPDLPVDRLSRLLLGISGRPA